MVGMFSSCFRVGAANAWFATIGLLLVPGLATEATVEVPGAEDGLYTTQQAASGKKLYQSKCALCHGSKLEGVTAVPLAGPVFAENWHGPPELINPWGQTATVEDLMYIISTTMPPGQARSLTTEQHAGILAYILQQNGYPAGATDLELDSPRLQKVKLTSGTPIEASAGPKAELVFIKGSAAEIAAGTGPTQEELNAAAQSTSDWLYHNHNYSGSRFVELDQINTNNAKDLRPVATFQLGEIANFQTGPIVYRGTMFVTTARTTVALDASTARPKWVHKWEPKDREIWLNNRGVAMKDGRLARGTPDGYLLLLNAQSGELIWARKIANPTLGETFTMSPLIYEDLILIGPAGSENGISGWVGAFRLSDGSEVWKFMTVPGAEDRGSESWGNPTGIKLGGGAVWTPFSFDLLKEELYVPVTNPAPDLAAQLRPGDNLYTNSLVALDIRTGKLRWHRQLISNDSHDWDLTQVSPLFETVVDGKKGKLVATVGKDGILRTLDRDDHRTLYETPVTTMKNENIPVTTAGVHCCPGLQGGVEWNGPAFNPGTNQLYVGAVDWCSTFWAAEIAHYIPGKLYFGGTHQMDATSRGWITSVDAATGQVQWRYPSATPVVAAVTTTSGDVVFGGELTGDFLVLDARSGKVLYRFNTGGPIGAGIITYQIRGKQYVAVMSGRPSPIWFTEHGGAPTVFLFSLP